MIVCMHVYTHIYVYVYYIRAGVYVCLYVCICARAHVYMYMCAHVCVHAWTHTHKVPSQAAFLSRSNDEINSHDRSAFQLTWPSRYGVHVPSCGSLPR